jgi:acetyltransferase
MIAIFIPPVLVDIGEVQGAIQKVSPLFQRQGKPLLTCTMGQPGFSGKLGSGDRFVPSYTFPEDAVLALVRTAEYREWQKRPTGTIPKIPGIRRGQARRIIETVLTSTTQRPLWLAASEVAELLGCYGIRIAEAIPAKTEVEAAAAASNVGFPVAVKLASSTIVHKTDVGGVKIDLKSAEEVKEAFRGIAARLTQISRQDEMEGVIVQRMVSGGVEAIVGVTQDPSFGPLIMFGLGGIFAELLKDVAVRLHPLTDLDARELVSSIKMARLFSGFRGAPPSDVASLEDLLLRLSALVEDVAEIAELDFNPVKVMPQGEGYWVVDARVMLR